MPTKSKPPTEPLTKPVRKLFQLEGQLFIGPNAFPDDEWAPGRHPTAYVPPKRPRKVPPAARP